MFGHNLRHFTVIKKMKDIIDSGKVGDVKAIMVSTSCWIWWNKLF